MGPSSNFQYTRFRHRVALDYRKMVSYGLSKSFDLSGEVPPESVSDGRVVYS